MCCGNSNSTSSKVLGHDLGARSCDPKSCQQNSARPHNEWHGGLTSFLSRNGYVYSWAFFPLQLKSGKSAERRPNKFRPDCLQVPSQWVGLPTLEFVIHGFLTKRESSILVVWTRRQPRPPYIYMYLEKERGNMFCLPSRRARMHTASDHTTPILLGNPLPLERACHLVVGERGRSPNRKGTLKRPQPPESNLFSAASLRQLTIVDNNEAAVRVGSMGERGARPNTFLRMWPRPKTRERCLDTLYSHPAT
jgi:hypothetical protein